jgi:hypothetical protein
MGRQLRAISPRIWLVFGLAMWLAALVGARANAPGAGPPEVGPIAENSAEVQTSSQAAPPQSGAGYVGQDTCVTCHEDQSKGRYEK